VAELVGSGDNWRNWCLGLEENGVYCMGMTMSAWLLLPFKTLLQTT